MAECRDCKYWTPIEGESDIGDCFGHKVQGSMDTANCPSQAYSPR
ncbi:hypothetical protein [Candidatus Hodarchaeum mangrovi]